MKLTRLDLDGAGSPAALVAKILAAEPNLPLPVPLEALCKALDITEITTLATEGFAAALLTDTVKSSGVILVARNAGAARRRFSIAHELGHFLIPTHRAGPSGFHCTTQDLTVGPGREADRHVRMEREANQFAALLLIPPPALRKELQQIHRPDVTDIVRLAQKFAVSKEAMARAYVEYNRAAVAVVIVRAGLVVRFYRNERQFPWLDVRPGQPVPRASVGAGKSLRPREHSEVAECKPGVWLGDRGGRPVEALTEQVLAQDNEFALILLHAELRDTDDEAEESGLRPSDAPDPRSGWVR